MQEVNELNFEKTIRGVNYSVNVGKMANQASAAVLMKAGETVVLCCATIAKEAKADIDFFPLTVDYMEKMYAAGKIPGGFFKRGGRPTDYEILKSRLVDRPLRPMFPHYLRNEVQIMCYVLSSDGVHQGDVLAIQGASIALNISEIPFKGPVSAVRVGMRDGMLVINETSTSDQEGTLDMVVAENDHSLLMVECGAKELSEGQITEAFQLAHQANQEFLAFQEEFIRAANPKAKLEIPEPVISEEAVKAVDSYLSSRIDDALFNPNKLQRENAVSQLKKDMMTALEADFEELKSDLDLAFENYIEAYVRKKIVVENIRPDGRKTDQVRPINIEIGLLPRVHGSGLFRRGQTQVLSLVTLGAKGEGQLIEGLYEEEVKHYMHYYNFPSFSVGETRPNRGPGRREVGHGALAERALLPVIPSEEDFPYTIHVVSEVLESNGSSSMASVCGSTLALMDAGVPISGGVAGIAMGLITEGSQYRILTDIQGVEDATGDMDFKVAGTRKGITALQMDIKNDMITQDIVAEGLLQARTARLHILDIMEKEIQTPRENLSKYAPRLQVIQIRTDKIGELIGPQGKVIKKIIEETEVKIDIEPDGRVYITAPDEQRMMLAVDAVHAVIDDIEVGKLYKGKVVNIREFGAFVEIQRGKDGLLHISQISQQRINKVEDVLHLGQELMVKVIGIDDQGRVSLSMKDI
ncbi:MAG TPA: polyribonucleotide nucleotidyltransferase [Caldisericia bacterium]|nr:polyribonucleotide nucleotidyltransferase [Caldisericia bacterium]